MMPRRPQRIPTLASLLILLPVTIAAQEVTYRTGEWVADSLGNHRAVLRVGKPADAVRAHIPWRRRDVHPERKDVIVVSAATGERVRNVYPVAVHREFGDIVFQADRGGEYYVYYLHYTGTITSNYPKIEYPGPSRTADPAWIERHRFISAPVDIDRLPKAKVVAFESVDEFNTFYPMEVIATAEETAGLAAKSEQPYQVFPEDREHPIRMMHDLPYRWIRTGSGGRLEGKPYRGEFFVFQLGVWGARGPVPNVGVTLDPLMGPDGATISADGFRCFNLGGIDWQGHAFMTEITVDSGAVQAVWCGLPVPVATAPGRYAGTLTVTARGLPSTPLGVRLEVRSDTIRNAGDDEPWRLSRLRWLDSQLAVDDSLVRPFTPVTMVADTVSVLGRRLIVGNDGFPRAIESSFTKAMTELGEDRREVLIAPMRLDIVDSTGRGISWRPMGRTVVSSNDGQATWAASSEVGPLTVRVEGRAEFDGNVAYTVAVQAREAVRLDDIRLVIPFAPEVARYILGMGQRGGARPDSLDWTWDVTRNQEGAWLGDVNAGLQFSLRDDRYRRPLNTNFYQSQPLVMPRSWDNGGKGGCRLRAILGEFRVSCYSGERTMEAGEEQRYDFVLLLTPFKTLNTADQWNTRFFHAYAPLDSIARMGASTINVHHATAINPWINYPFLRPDTMRAYIAAAHQRGMRVKIYYTVRELTIKAPELFPLRSLGHEVFSPGPGGGFSWLQEHVGDDYIAAWHVPEIKDAAIINTGISRWHNFYVEGLHWLVDNVGIDGLYIDDVAFDRSVMKRVRKALDRGRPRPMIDLHSANQYNPRDGFVNSANLYMEHFPFLDRLWFGEYFEYDRGPDYWLTEVSGIPFGLMGEMLEKGGNPWRGMLYGMTARLPWSGDPRPLWRLWDEFGIEESRMIGYWVPDRPVRTNRSDVLATSYVKDGSALIAIASWSDSTQDVTLEFDWDALGLAGNNAILEALPIEGLQSARAFLPYDPIPVEPGKGVILVASPLRD